MRWERLFDDVEAQWRAAETAQLQAEVADRIRRERAAVSLMDRLAVQVEEVEVLTLGGRRIVGDVVDLGVDFVLLGEGHLRRLVPLAAVVQVTGLTRRVAGPHTASAVRRFALGTALRAVARDRAPIALDDTWGRRVTGTVEAVGSDHLELSEHPLDLPGRPEAVVARRVVPFAAMVCVSSG